MSPTAPVFATTGRLGSSGTWEVPSPSPSLHEAALGLVPPGDKTRQSAFAAIAHARAVANAAAADARLSIIGRHAKAAEVSAKAILPALDTIEKARKIYEHELTGLREKLAGPVIEASEIQIAEVRSCRIAADDALHAGFAKHRQRQRFARGGRGGLRRVLIGFSERGRKIGNPRKMAARQNA
jgi:hypothetical protein